MEQHKILSEVQSIIFDSVSGGKILCKDFAPLASHLALNRELWIFYFIARFSENNQT